jgi:hypothetical protein
MLKPLMFAMILSMFGCSNANLAQFAAWGNPGHIVCYSGGKVIYEGDSTGKISTESQSDGWYFQEKGTNQLIRVSGACVIRN